MAHDDVVYAELLKINESLGSITSTVEGLDARMDNIEGLYGRVQEIEKRAAGNTGYVKGVGAAVAFLFAVVGALAGFIIL